MEPIGTSEIRLADAEVRQATILRCDIVGSTRVKRMLDLDDPVAYDRDGAPGLPAGLDQSVEHVGRVGGHDAPR